MKTEQLLAIFEKVKSEEGAIQTLRELILKLAISGNLTQKQADDGEVSALISDIQIERENKIKTKQIKNNKVVSKGLNYDNLPKVPEHWHWTKLGLIGDWGSGSTPSRSKPEYFTGPFTWLKSGELNDNMCLQNSEEKISQQAIDDGSFRRNKRGDVLIAMYGGETIGSLAILGEDAVTNQAVCGCTLFTGVDKKYLFYFLASHRENFTKAGVGGVQSNISKEKIVDTVFPLPPLEEQKRIVAKVDELMALCDTLEEQKNYQSLASKDFSLSTSNALTKREDFENWTQAKKLFLDYFPRHTENHQKIKLMKQTVLKLAIQGKLLLQMSEGETGAELLKKIQFAKEQDTDAGGHSRSKKTSNLALNYLKFPIPETWAWTSLAEIGYITPKVEAEDDVEASFVPMPSIHPEYGQPHETENRKWKSIKKGYTKFSDGDVGLAKITPCFENGKSAIFQNLKNGIGAGTTELHVVRPYLIEPRFILVFLKSSYFIENGIPLMTGTAGQKRVPSDYFSNCPFPLPPLEEQKRIVSKVNSLLALCDQLEASLESETAIKSDLLKSLVA